MPLRRFSSASISGGIRSTSRCKSSNSPFQLCPFHAVFDFAALAGSGSCFQLLIFFQQVIDCDLVLFQLPGEILHLREPLFQQGEGFLFFFPAFSGLMPSSVASMALACRERGNRLFEKAGVGICFRPVLLALSPRSKSGYFSTI